MSQISARKRLCQVVLGSELKAGQPNGTIVSIPVLCEDISSTVLFAAHEAIYSYTPSHVRQVLPFVLHAIEDGDFVKDDSGFIDAFFLHLNYEFCLGGFDAAAPSADATRDAGLRYRPEYRENWTANTLSTMTRFEHGWAYAWVCELLEGDAPDAGFYTRQDLVMAARLLAMALGKKETEAPSF